MGLNIYGIFLMTKMIVNEYSKMFGYETIYFVSWAQVQSRLEKSGREYLMRQEL